jgi:hypothetical protein
LKILAFIFILEPMKTVVLLFIMISFAFSSQAQRDTVEASDSIVVNPLNGLRYINLIVKSESGSSFVFQVDGDTTTEKVSYFGNNLADYVSNVASAKKKISEYRTLRVTQTGLLVSGIILTALGTTFTIQDGEVSPTILFGIGTAAFSWIPAYLTQNKISEAVGSYNETLQRHQKVSLKGDQ